MRLLLTEVLEAECTKFKGKAVEAKQAIDRGSDVNLKNMALDSVDILYQWIGLRENLQETIDFPINYGTFL